MIGDVVTRRLPNGRIPFERISDANVKHALMCVNDNIAELKKQLEEAQAAINELRRR